MHRKCGIIRINCWIQARDRRGYAERHSPRRAQANPAIASFLQQRIALLDQPIELFILLRETIRVALLILGPRKRRGLLDQLPDIVANNRDAILDFGERKRTTVGHYGFPWSMDRSGAVGVGLREGIADRLG